MKKCLNNTMRLTRILKNGMAVLVAVLVVNTLKAQPATPNGTSTTQNGTQAAAPNQSGNSVDNSSTAVGNNQSGNSATAQSNQNGNTPNGNQAPTGTAPVATAPATPDASGTVANNDTVNTQRTSHRAKEFIKDAAQANSAEIALSELAQSKAQNSDVKQLAEMMVTDHQACNQKLQGIAQARGVEFDQSLDWINQHEVNRLQKSREGDFDKDYTKIMLKDHVKAIKMFQKAADDIQEPDVKEFAANALPKLREHLRHAEDAARAVGLDDSTVTSIVKDVPTGGTN
jgi:putative membrane protein